MKKYNKWSCRADSSSFWDSLACWLSKGVLKQGFLNIYISTFFTLRNFGNINPKWAIFFKTFIKISEIEQKIQKMQFESKFVAVKPHYYEEKTSDRQSMC